MEAAELPADSGEVWDIDMLVSALYALRSFWFSEAEEGEIVDPVTAAQNNDTAGAADEEGEELVLELNTVADLVKAATADDATDESKSALADLTKALGLDGIDDKIAAAVTKASEANEESISALRGELAKVAQGPAPDGPSLVKPANTGPAGQDHLTKAVEYDRLAEAATSTSLANGYRDLAARTRAEAKQLTA